MEAKLRRDAVNAVDGVEVLDDEHLEAGGAALAGSDHRPGEEELPDLQCVSHSVIHSGQHAERWELRTLYHLWPYLAVMGSALPTQLRYHLQIVAE